MQNFTQILKKFSCSDQTGQLSGTAALDPHRTIFVADLPKSITYLELSDYFEQGIGPCEINIRRYI